MLVKIWYYDGSRLNGISRYEEVNNWTGGLPKDGDLLTQGNYRGRVERARLVSDDPDGLYFSLLVRI